jgi:hypothetical protein
MNETQKTGQTFCIQKEGEHVKKVIRKALIIELPWLVGVTGIFILLILFQLSLSSIAFEKNLLGLLTFVTMNLLLFLGLYTFNRLLNWFYSVNIITDQRLLDFEFSDIGGKNIVECELADIQSITLQNQGLLSFLFRLSTIKILTSGDNPNVDFEFIEHPTKVQNLISDLARKVQNQK